LAGFPVSVPRGDRVQTYSRTGAGAGRVQDGGGRTSAGRERQKKSKNFPAALDNRFSIWYSMNVEITRRARPGEKGGRHEGNPIYQRDYANGIQNRTV